MLKFFLVPTLDLWDSFQYVSLDRRLTHCPNIWTFQGATVMCHVPADKEEQKGNVQLLQRYCVLYYVRHTCRNSCMQSGLHVVVIHGLLLEYSANGRPRF
jgi:hypothetical protein